MGIDISRRACASWRRSLRDVCRAALREIPASHCKNLQSGVGATASEAERIFARFELAPLAAAHQSFHVRLQPILTIHNTLTCLIGALHR